MRGIENHCVGGKKRGQEEGREGKLKTGEARRGERKTKSEKEEGFTIQMRAGEGKLKGKKRTDEGRVGGER